jgi:hypothetical protein
VTLFDVLDEAAVGGLPAQEFLRDGAGGGHVGAEQRHKFFRHFADKREVLFGGEDVLAGLFADAIRAASPEATLTECLQAAFAAADVAMTPQQRAKAAKRVLVVAANSELQERGLLKHARMARSVTAALREGGIDELTARLGAEVGLLAFTIAVERWMQADNDGAVRGAGAQSGTRDPVASVHALWSWLALAGPRSGRDGLRLLAGQGRPGCAG